MKVRVIRNPRYHSEELQRKVEGLVFRVVHPKDPYYTEDGYYIDLTPAGDLGRICFFHNEELGVVEEVDKRKLIALMTTLQRLVARHERGLIKLDEASFELFELAKRVYRVNEYDEKSFQEILTELADFNK